MDKAIEAFKIMAANPKAITDVTPKKNSPGGEIYFIYDGKSKWSILRSNAEAGSYTAYYYPGNETIEQLLKIENWPTANNYLSFASTKLGPEAKEVLAGLYRTVSERRFNVNELFDEIISSAPRT